MALSLLLLAGCGKKKVEQPQVVVPREEMISLMADMELTEAALRYRQGRLSHDSLKKITDRAFDSLYTWYRINPEVFKENLAYYQHNLDDFQKMLDEVILRLTREKDSIANLPLLTKDSLL